MLKPFFTLFLLLAVALPFVAGAQYKGLVPCGTEYFAASDPRGGEVSNPCTFGSFFVGIKSVTDALILIGTSVAALSFSYAGFLYMSAAGDEGKVEHAHEIFKKVAWGFVIMLGAWLIVYTIQKALVVDTFPSFLK